MKMPFFNFIAILALTFGEPIFAEEFKIELSEKDQKQFPKGLPLKITSELKDGEILIKATNRSKKIMAVTKHAASYSFEDIYADGTKGQTAGGGAIMTLPQYLDHIILLPFTPPSGSPRIIAKYPPNP